MPYRSLEELFSDRLRKALLIVGIFIIGFLFAIFVPILPAQLFLRGGNCGFGCPLVLAHDQQVPGGWVMHFLYSITRYTRGFGGSYNVDEGYVVTGPSFGDGFLTGFGLFVLTLPLFVVSVACFALAFLFPGNKIRRRRPEL